MAAEGIVLIYTTLASLDEAEACGRALVERRLAACVNILPRMVSIYEWEGALGREEEVVMLVKTRASLAEAARSALAEIHPYDTPAMLTIATGHVNEAYRDWLMERTEG